MAQKYLLSSKPTSKTLTLLLSLLFWAVLTPSAHALARPISKEELGPNKAQQTITTTKDKNNDLTHLHFYFRDYVAGPNPTAIRVAQAATTNQSPGTFGALVMIDDPLTEGEDSGSKVVGRAQGMYGFADQQQAGLLMVMDFVFSEGEYNGSTLSVLGRNQVMSNERELAVVGGSGVFRFATGYAQAKTITLLDTNGATVVEYNVYIKH